MHDPHSAERGGARSMQPLSPVRSICVLRIFTRITGVASPDLAAEFEIVVDDSDADATLCRASGGCDAGGASANHQNIEMATLFPVHDCSVAISMSCSHNTWQLRTCGFPLTITRHSKQ